MPDRADLEDQLRAYLACASAEPVPPMLEESLLETVRSGASRLGTWLPVRRRGQGPQGRGVLLLVSAAVVALVSGLVGAAVGAHLQVERRGGGPSAPSSPLYAPASPTSRATTPSPSLRASFTPDAAPLSAPRSVAVDAAGTVYVVGDDARVVELTSSGTRAALSFDALRDGRGTSATNPSITADSSGGLYVGAWAYGQYHVFDVGADGSLTVVFDGWVWGVCLAVDPAGALHVAEDFGQGVTPAHQFVRRVNRDGTTTVVAGTGTLGVGGDGVLATAGRLNEPHGIAFDASGNLYIAETSANRVRKVAPDGIITTVAGTGTAGFGGDGGPAVAALLSGPVGIAVDRSGNLYIGDTGNNRVRRVAPDGTITTVAGTGTPGFDGDGGPATSAQLAQPSGVAVASDGSVVIADKGNGHVRRIGRDGRITTVL